MKNLCLMLIVFCCLGVTQSVKGQTYYPESEFKYFNGYIVNLNNDTINGKIRYHNYLKMQDRVYFKNTDNVMSVYSPTDLIGFGYSSESYYWLSTTHTILKTSDGKDRFVIIEEIGGVSYYKYYKKDDTKDIGYSDVVLLIKPGEKPTSQQKFFFGFKKNFSKYLSDNEEIAKKIANKEKGYKMLSQTKIIREYNAWYLKTHPDFTVIKVKK